MENLTLKNIDDEIILVDDSGEQLGEISFQSIRDNTVWAVTHTGVSPKLRGRGIAGKLLDALVERAEGEGVKLKAICPYVVKKFNEEPDTYDEINADK